MDVTKRFETLDKTSQDWHCRSCIKDIFPFFDLNNKKVQNMFSTTQTQNQKDTSRSGLLNHRINLPFSSKSNDELRSLSFNSNKLSKDLKYNYKVIHNVYL